MQLLRQRQQAAAVLVRAIGTRISKIHTDILLDASPVFFLSVGLSRRLARVALSLMTTREKTTDRQHSTRLRVMMIPGFQASSVFSGSTAASCEQQQQQSTTRRWLTLPLCVKKKRFRTDFVIFSERRLLMNRAFLRPSHSHRVITRTLRSHSLCLTLNSLSHNGAFCFLFHLGHPVGPCYTPSPQKSCTPATHHDFPLWNAHPTAVTIASHFPSSSAVSVTTECTCPRDAHHNLAPSHWAARLPVQTAAFVK
jgi:hypothetical protein